MFRGTVVDISLPHILYHLSKAQLRTVLGRKILRNVRKFVGIKQIQNMRRVNTTKNPLLLHGAHWLREKINFKFVTVPNVMQQQQNQNIFV